MTSGKKIFDLLISIMKVFWGIRDQFEYFPRKSTVPSFKKELRKFGYKVIRHVDFGPEGYCQNHPHETRSLVLKYYEKSSLYTDRVFYLDCLFSKENSDLFPFFYQQYDRYTDLFNEQLYLCDLILNCIYMTKHIKWKQEYVKLFNDKITISEKLDLFLYVLGELQIEEALPQLKSEFEWSSGYARDVLLLTLKKYETPKIKELKKSEKTVSFDTKKITSQMLEKGLISFTGEVSDRTILEFVKQLPNMNCKNEDAMIQYCQNNPEKTRNIVLEYYKKSALVQDKCFYMKCLTSEKNIDLFPFLELELREWVQKSRESGDICNALANDFYYSRNKVFVKEYLQILKNPKYFHYNYLIIELCGKLRLEEVKPYLLDIVKSEDHIFLNSALNALSYYKDKKEYQDIFVKYSKSKDEYTRGIAKKALKSIGNSKNNEVQKKRMV